MNALGSGGMSSVYRAVHVESGHEVALKVLPPYMARNATVLRRFIGEAKSAQALEHPNIVSIYDRGSDQERYYLVLEYVKGGDFHEYVQRGGPMQPAEAIEVIRQVAKGLEYAATRGLIHRDVKPSNLLRTPTGQVKITDLGLALRSADEDERVTREGTTVGTVDYMAPEQARDSRATSLQSDIYSLGCTFYYMLTALPPFPGGDITDRLSRHARQPAPNVRELRPNVPEALAAILLKMMAKRPEERYASYQELLSALALVSQAAANDESTVALVPIEEAPLPPTPKRPERRGVIVDLNPTPQRNETLPEISLASLTPALLGESTLMGLQDDVVSLRDASTPEPVVALALEAPRPYGPTDSSISEKSWVIRCVVLGLLTIVVVISLDLLLRPYPNFSTVGNTEEVEDFIPRIGRQRDDEELNSEPNIKPVHIASPRPIDSQNGPPTGPVVDAWTEPVDPVFPPRPPKPYSPEVLALYLPGWGRVPVPSQVEGPTTLVQRVSEHKDPGAVGSLRLALDVPKGTVEIGDVGPYFLDDARVAGGTRLIRGRPGYRPVVRIEGPQLDAVRALPGVFTLDGRNLTLDSLDLVVNVRDLGMNQRALFHCAGSQLTLKNCTVTIVNPLRAPFTFIRTDDAASRGSRIRIESSLIRGDVGPLFELGRGSVELMIARSIVVGDGPIVRTPETASQAQHRLYVLGSALGCRGPSIDLGGSARTEASPRRLTVRAFDTAFGRFAGAGVASLASSENDSAVLTDQLDWFGAENVYSGWRSYFASGPDHTIRVRNLQTFRSTWSARERDAREILAEWPAPAAIADLVPDGLAPHLPGGEALVKHVARPRPFLLAKTLLSFPVPQTPGVTAWAVAAPADAAPSPGSTAASLNDGEPVDLVFDTDSAQWNGDLGAFLREEAKADRRHLRVRVFGSGVKRCSPAKLPDGMVLEMRVEKPKGADDPWLTLTPEAESQGRALIELQGGALVLSRFRFRAEDDAKLDALIRVDDGHLILHQCELTAPQASDSPMPRLIDYRAASTRPRLTVPEIPLFTTPSDRPVCLISECVLLTGGSGLRAEIGLGFIGLTECVMATRGDAIDLAPAHVARGRFLADLAISRCTVVSGAAIVRLAAWPGEEPGPDRPWLISSANTAYLDFLDRVPRESVLFRADATSFAQGQAFWQQANDAVEVFGFAAAGTEPPPNRTRDIVTQWVNLWGSTHVRAVSGPRPGGAYPTVRLLEKPRPGRMEAGDLILDADYHPGRPLLDLGANPGLLGIAPRSAAARKR